jgi:hypothetical protein
MHTNTLSPEHHTVKMWTPQVVSDAAAIALKLASNFMSHTLSNGADIKTCYIVKNLLDAAKSGSMLYTYECLSHAEHWMGDEDKAHLNSLFPELAENRTKVINALA